jgi:hypothetical protein
MKKTKTPEVRARLRERSYRRYHGLPIADHRRRQHSPQVLAQARAIAAEWAELVLPAVRKAAWRAVRYWHWLTWENRRDFVAECCGVAWVQTLGILATGKHDPLTKGPMLAWSSVKRVKAFYFVCGYEHHEDVMSRRARMLRKFKLRLAESLAFDDWLASEPAHVVAA